MTMLVDVHAHLDSEKFKDDIDEVISRARDAGLNSIVCNGLNPESNRNLLSLAKAYPGIIKVAMGIYPIDCISLSDSAIDAEIGYIKSQKGNVVAIGEIGIDYHWDKTEDGHEKQKAAFRRFLKLAKELDVPAIVHSRDAEEEAIKILEDEECKKVVMHCFGGSIELAKRIEKNKWMLSIPANVIISGHFQRIVKEININQLLTETDAPYLGPVKGERNEPANIAKSIRKIAELKGMTVEETEKNVFMNYQRMFL